MFFKNYLIYIFLKFLLVGLYFGLAHILFKLLNRLTKNNIYAHNALSFVFWLAFGAVFAFLSIALYDYSFCWFGLLGMFLGLILVKISIEFFFTKLFLIIYNRAIKNFSRKKFNGKQQQPA